MDSETPLADPEAERAATLMVQYCQGDRSAFDALYQTVAPRLLRYIMGFVGTGGTGGRALAEDLLQQTFLKVHAARGSYVRGANPVPWFYTIAHRTCLDELRKRKRTPVLFRNGSGEEEGAAMSEGPVAELDGVAEGARELPRFDPVLSATAMAALAGLPSGQRDALLLTKVHGHSVAQAATILGTTPGAIKLRSHRGYVALRKRLRMDGP